LDKRLHATFWRSRRPLILIWDKNWNAAKSVDRRRDGSRTPFLYAAAAFHPRTIASATSSARSRVAIVVALPVAESPSLIMTEQ